VKEPDAFDYPDELDPERDHEHVRDEEDPYYLLLLKNALENAPVARRGIPIVNIALNFKHLRLFHEDGQGRKLSRQLGNFPSQFIPIIDLVLNEEAADIWAAGPGMEDGAAGGGMPPITPVVRTRVWNLPQFNEMRRMEISHIDRLVSIRGMVVRASSIIPEMRRAFYRCAACPGTMEVEVDRGRVEEPGVCGECGGKGTMEIVHNRSSFTDKQLVKLQEAPECVPEGETPAQIALYVYEEMVDAVVPGDRVVVTGIFRALPIRLNPRTRSIRSVFNTVVDVIHFAKSDKERLATMEGGEGSSSREYSP